MLCPDQAAQGPTAAPPAIPHNPTIHTHSPSGLKQAFPPNFIFTQKVLS